MERSQATGINSTLVIPPNRSEDSRRRQFSELGSMAMTLPEGPTDFDASSE